MIVGADVKRLLDKRGWAYKDLAEVLNQALGRNYGSGSISPWVNDKRSVPPDVAAFIETLMIDSALPPEQQPPPAEDDTPPADVPPGDGPPADVQPQPPLTAGGTYARACTELWQIIASGVGMVGAATGSQAMMMDGAIIDADKEALGAAWGKLAEENETFRKMLRGMTEGGAWLQVCLVTGTTASKMYQNHAQYAQLAPPPPRDEDGTAGVHAAA